MSEKCFKYFDRYPNAIKDDNDICCTSDPIKLLYIEVCAINNILLDTYVRILTCTYTCK